MANLTDTLSRSIDAQYRGPVLHDLGGASLYFATKEPTVAETHMSEALEAFAWGELAYPSD
jgi:hypothetical protein